jgi:hypothetical protein
MATAPHTAGARLVAENGGAIGALLRGSARAAARQSPQLLRALQRSVGNRATSRLVAAARQDGAAGRVRPTPRGSLVLARQPQPEPPKAGSNFTAQEGALLAQARATLKPEGTAIVGVLIPEGGAPIFLRSGGGQGFSSHVEGKATAKMRELGITRAKLIVELEPCQICDRSTYPGPDVPSQGVKSTASGKDIPLQISKINTALPRGAKLTVAGPETTGMYEGVVPPAASGPPQPSDLPHPDPKPSGAGVGSGGGSRGGSSGRGSTTASVGDAPPPIGADEGVQNFQGRSAAASAMATVIVGALNNISNWITDYAVKKAWEREMPAIQKTLSEQPWLGVLVAFTYTQGSAPIGMQAPRVFQGLQPYYDETQAQAQAQERASPPAVDVAMGQVINQEKWIPPQSPGSKPKPPPRAAPAQGTRPASASDLDANIDKAIGRNAWGEVALNLNGFNTDDIKTKVTSDARLSGHRRELMKGALATMILWPARKDGVTDAIANADPAAARQGRIDYLDDILDTGRGGEPARNFAPQKWKSAALALDGFNDADLRVYVPHDVEKCKLIRDACIKAQLDRVKKAIEDAKPGQDWSIV